jgi:methylated-DNA-[protein]-cysteine S-methyltransferase
MTALGWCLFDTAIGACALAWSTSGICAVLLPEASPAHTRSRMARDCAPALECPAPLDMCLAAQRIAALLGGAPDDLQDLVLDMAGVPPFHQRVYALARTIAPGCTLTYGALAARLGQPGAARAVGQALGRNPFAPIVPCHRVLAAGGRGGGFSAHGGVDAKLRMLHTERAHGAQQPGLF